MQEQIPRIDFVKNITELKHKWINALRKDNTGIGFTLETKVGIRENNYSKHDFIDTLRPYALLFDCSCTRTYGRAVNWNSDH